MTWFWIFVCYSFIGFLLEITYARATKGCLDRKCLLVLPLCPVYGLGACAILLLPPWTVQRPWMLFLLSAIVATAVEYGTAVFYEQVFGVSFWDYRDLPGNLQGRVCLPFSLAWGALALPMVYWLHPHLTPWLRLIPLPISRQFTLRHSPVPDPRSGVLALVCHLAALRAKNNRR